MEKSSSMKERNQNIDYGIWMGSGFWTEIGKLKDRRT